MIDLQYGKREAPFSLRLSFEERVRLRDAAGDTGLRREFKTAPLLTPDELARKVARRAAGSGTTAGGLTLVLVSGAHPFVCDRVHYGELV